jgi:hypothetical protein
MRLVRVEKQEEGIGSVINDPMGGLRERVFNFTGYPSPGVLMKALLKTPESQEETPSESGAVVTGASHSFSQERVRPGNLFRGVNVSIARCE